MNGKIIPGFDFAAAVHRIAGHVDDAAEQSRPDRHLDRLAGVLHRLAAGQTVGRVHGNGANHAFAQLLLHLKHQPFALIVAFKRGIDVRQVVQTVKLDVDNGAHHLKNMSRLFCFFAHQTLLNPALNCLGAGNNFHQFGGDRRLPHAVIPQRQTGNHVAGVAGRVVH